MNAVWLSVFIVVAQLCIFVDGVALVRQKKAIAAEWLPATTRPLAREEDVLRLLQAANAPESRKQEEYAARLLSQAQSGQGTQANPRSISVSVAGNALHVQGSLLSTASATMAHDQHIVQGSVLPTAASTIEGHHRRGALVSLLSKVFATKANGRQSVQAEAHTQRQQPASSASQAKSDADVAPLIDNAGEQEPKVIGLELVEIIVGASLVVICTTLLIITEHYTAKISSVMALGRSECKTVSKPEPENVGELVHVVSSPIAGQSIEDPDFKGSRIEGNILRLRTTIEVYQWKENPDTGQYEEVWSSEMFGSSTYKDASKKNKFEMIPKVTTHNCSLVTFAGFVLPEAFLDKMDMQFVSAAKLLGDTVYSKQDGLELRKSGDYFCHQYKEGEDEIGDVRVKFETLDDGDGSFSVLALQAESVSDHGRYTFLPYRAVDRGLFFSQPPSWVKRRRTVLGRKTEEEIRNTDVFSVGFVGAVCCLCTFARSRFVTCFNFRTCEIFALQPDELTQEEMFNSLDHTTTSRIKTYVFNMFLHILLFVGFYLFFAPVVVAFKPAAPLPQALVGLQLSFTVVLTLWATCWTHCIVVALCYQNYTPRRSAYALAGTIFWAFVGIGLGELFFRGRIL